MADIPANAAVHCPGTQSDTAGKASACAGCPNQNLCSTGATKGQDPNLALIRERLVNVKNKLLVLSGKGGVGKSTVTSLLARAMSLKHPDKNFGVLDIDICGPSQPRMFGVLDEQVHQSGSGWSPVNVDENLSLMSIGFLLNSPDDAIIWRGPKKNGIIGQFLSQVDWDQLDYLVLDTPPGTSDEHLSATTYLKGSGGKWGAVLVTTPHEISLLDVRKEINFCKKNNVPIVGVIENMSLFVCPNPVCGTESVIFPASTGGAARMCTNMNVPFLGRLPLDPRIARACDVGDNFVDKYGMENVTVRALVNIIGLIIEFFERSGEN